MIVSIVGKFQLKILMAEAAPKNVCSQKTSFGQTILEQPLPKNLKAEISNTILRLSREPKSLIWCESLTQRTNVSRVSYIEFLCFHQAHTYYTCSFI